MIHVCFIVSGAFCLCYNDRLRSHRTPVSLVRNAFFWIYIRLGYCVIWVALLHGQRCSEVPPSCICFMNTVHHSLTWCVYSILSNCLSDLRLIRCTKYVLGFKKGSGIGAQFIRQYDCKGRHSRLWHHQETREQKSRIKSTVRSDPSYSQKLWPCIFSLIYKHRLSYDISYDRFVASLQTKAYVDRMYALSPLYILS